uniref:Uncharacterized protein n=1 Tax=Pyrodinium bahamense TaxID=73915 RepID=A0A7S0BA48_9DINO|mmetsp:Transcript_6733/g.18529  ORF Transcript_6733/g.18529 Transcript_6733/m.18529 type:complete len:133 (+) Transcript_6733:103-501(+)
MAELTEVKVEDLLVCGACCCTINSLYCKMPECIGFKNSGVICCMRVQLAGCKPIREENEDKKCCVWNEGGVYCIIPYTCCLDQQQLFCLDSRCAFPCNEKVPCICTLLPFFVLAADWKLKPKCCAKVSDLMG